MILRHPIHRNNGTNQDRRQLLRGLGAAGAMLLLGPACSTPSGALGPRADLQSAPADTGATGNDLGAADFGAPTTGTLPPIDLAAPKTIQTATFALG